PLHYGDGAEYGPPLSSERPAHRHLPVASDPRSGGCGYLIRRSDPVLSLHWLARLSGRRSRSNRKLADARMVRRRTGVIHRGAFGIFRGRRKAVASRAIPPVSAVRLRLPGRCTSGTGTVLHLAVADGSRSGNASRRLFRLADGGPL